MVAGASKNLPVGFLIRVPGQNLITSEHQTGTREPRGDTLNDLKLAFAAKGGVG